jgi:hypothetical protein
MAVKKTTDSAQAESAAVAVRQISNDDLLNISSFEDALAFVAEQYGDVLAADEVIGNGFRMLADKNKLVGTPFVAVQWKFHPGDFDGYYTNMLVVTDQGDRYIVNDGGAGITRELMEFSKRSNRMGGVVFRNGLSASTYTFCATCQSAKCEDDTNSHKLTPATTFYLDLSA